MLEGTFSHVAGNMIHVVGKITALFGPRHAKTFLRANADSERPGQPAHPRSLIRAFIAH